jgi:hypothetical protein
MKTIKPKVNSLILYHRAASCRLIYFDRKRNMDGNRDISYWFVVTANLNIVI